MSRRSRYRNWKKRKARNKIIIIGLLTALIMIIGGIFLVNYFDLFGKDEIEADAMDITEGIMSMEDITEIPTTEATSEEPTTETTTEATEPLPPPYDYSLPVPECDPVDELYFADAVFIGDSRTQGLFLYSGIEGAMNLAAKGLTVKTAFTKDVVKDSQGNKATVIGALSEKEYSKVYIGLGLNELGWLSETIFVDDYKTLIDAVREVQPSATLYIQLIIPVTKSKSESDTVFNNENIANYNNLIKEMVLEKEIYYIDVSEALCDENGYLLDDATSDGIHLNKTFCEKWYEYLKLHTVKKE